MEAKKPKECFIVNNQDNFIDAGVTRQVVSLVIIVKKQNMAGKLFKGCYELWQVESLKVDSAK